MSRRVAPPLYAVAAFYREPEDLLEAARATRARDLGRVAAYSPAPVPGLEEALHGTSDAEVRIVGVSAAIVGGACFFAFLAWSATISYVFLIGNRPAFAWPYYVVPSVSIGAMSGAVVATLAFLLLNRLPRLNHPAFNIAGFERVTTDRYVLTVEPTGDDFDPGEVERLLGRLPSRPLSTERVPR